MHSWSSAEPKIIKVDIDEQPKLQMKVLRQIYTRNFDVRLYCALYSTDIPVLLSVERSWQASAANSHGLNNKVYNLNVYT